MILLLGAFLGLLSIPLVIASRARVARLSGARLLRVWAWPVGAWVALLVLGGPSGGRWLGAFPGVLGEVASFTYVALFFGSIAAAFALPVAAFAITLVWVLQRRGRDAASAEGAR